MSLLWAVIASQGCGINLSGPGENTSAAESHGREVSIATSYANIRWSRTGDRFTFESPDRRTAVEYQLASGITRDLFSNGQFVILDVQQSADGLEFYTRSEGGEGGQVIRRHAATGTTVLSDSARSAFFVESEAQEGSPLLVAPSGAAAAFVIEPFDQLVLARRGEEPRVIAPGCSGLMAFSPDESRVLCRDGIQPAPGLVAVDLTTGAAEPLAIPSEVAAGAKAVHWDAGGFRMVYGGHFSPLSLYEQATNPSRTLVPAFGLFPESGPDGISWSLNGARVAYWTSYCAQSAGLLGGCLINQAFLYVLDVATGRTRRVAVHTGGAMNAAISPTGTTIAYAINGLLYLLDVR
jgi:dipeptidyl aminopeptidase/acylaminoacyl peptidase